MKFKPGKLIMIFVIFSVLAAVVLLVFPMANTVVLWPEPDEKPLRNPLKGPVAWGASYEDDPNVTLAYIPVHWAEVEPQEGRYDFDALEKSYSMSRWRADGVRFIFRILLDEPDGERHMDIPEWLYDKTNGAGTWYDCPYGKGFSPDYRNEALQAAHGKLLVAFAERYADDPHTAYVQLGSLGHWGEWHVYTKAGIARFPDKQITDRYVQDYLKAFPASMLLMRRPFDIGAEENLGLYNDSFGDPESHELWLDWIENGYVSDQNGDKLEDMRDFWQEAPSGGELSSDYDDEWYFSDRQFETTMRLTRQSHTTFIGPHRPRSTRLSKAAWSNAQQFFAELGYCFRISRAKVRNLCMHKPLYAELTIDNLGIAPIYKQWPLRLMLFREGEAVWQEDYAAPFTSYMPGKHTFSAPLNGTEKLEPGRYTLAAGIVDPITGEPGVQLAMLKRENCAYILGDIHIMR